jgi:hypothetical protein
MVVTLVLKYLSHDISLKNILQTEKYLTLQAASEKAEAETKSISLERDDLARVSFWVS